MESLDMFIDWDNNAVLYKWVSSRALFVAT